MNVVMLSPGYPAEMPQFTAGLAAVGAQVIGVGDQPEDQLPEQARRALARYVRVPSLWDEPAMIEGIRRLQSEVAVHRVECLWEPGIIIAAHLREALGLPGLGVERSLVFRDKERMKQELDAAGIRTPRHARVGNAAECHEAAERIGFPLVLKPIAGAGSADTYRVDGPTELQQVLERVRHVQELSVEEYVDGEEFTYDTICANGEILYENVAWYRPKPLIGRTVEWISPQTLTLRDIDAEPLRPGRELGRAALRVLGFRDGFSHMEWFRTPSGEAVFGEIAARPPGARSVDLMNFACDVDTYSGWAEAVVHGRWSQPIMRRYNSAVVFKRAQGRGRIRRIEGLQRLVARYRQHIVCVDLLPVGAPRRDWRKTLISDGYLIVRHPDLQATMDMADRIGTDLQIHAQ